MACFIIPIVQMKNYQALYKYFSMVCSKKFNLNVFNKKWEYSCSCNFIVKS